MPRSQASVFCNFLFWISWLNWQTATLLKGFKILNVNKGKKFIVLQDAIFARNQRKKQTQVLCFTFTEKHKILYQYWLYIISLKSFLSSSSLFCIYKQDLVTYNTKNKFKSFIKIFKESIFNHQIRSAFMDQNLSYAE